MSYSEMLQLAQDTARRAGDYARDQFSSVRVSYKAGEQIVTQLDHKCQEIIIEIIRQRYGEHGLIAEEGRQGRLLKIAPSGQDDIWWVIDPIDGTRNFAHGASNYAVSIGVLENGEPVVGAIYDPCTDMMFTGRRGEPAKCNGRVIHCLDETLNANSQLTISGNMLPKIGSSCMAELMDKYVYINLGSAALHFGYIAMGAYSAAFACDIKLWDMAAGAIICSCAGAEVNDMKKNPRFPIDCHAYQGESLPILIAAESIQEQLGQIFAKHTNHK